VLILCIAAENWLAVLMLKLYHEAYPKMVTPSEEQSLGTRNDLGGKATGRSLYPGVRLLPLMSRAENLQSSSPAVGLWLADVMACRPPVKNHDFYDPCRGNRAGCFKLDEMNNPDGPAHYRKTFHSQQSPRAYHRALVHL
jgi:hypothetical protein